MEIEIKVKINDRKIIRKKLLALSAIFQGKTHQVDTYFSLYKRPYTKKRGSIVRLRRNVDTKKVILAFHTDKRYSETDECEIEVSDLKETQRMLKLMKARPEAVVDKVRQHFKLGRFLIVLDKVKGLGDYIEVELESKNYQDSIKKILDFYKKLGIDAKSNIRYPGYLQLTLAKKNKKYICF